mmetsp:Transcript_5635/g.8679  ORF Transcript_5635/g.8679 Transcript_5635/m.8679 type:complete len:145 (+) Transcript_5635:90-524(+)
MWSSISNLLICVCVLIPFPKANAFVSRTPRRRNALHNVPQTSSSCVFPVVSKDYQPIKSMWDDEDLYDKVEVEPTPLPKDPPRGSVEALAVAVSLFFVVTVSLVGKDLFAVAPSTSSSQPIQRIDAEALLREDFERYREDSVTF